MEYQLRDFLAHNLSSIRVNGKALKIYVDENGVNGIEYPSGVGPMDILAQDQQGNLYVFELKRSKSPDKAIGQIARYMGWLRRQKDKDVQVFGVIVARESQKISSTLLMQYKTYHFLSIQFLLC